jgi:hypothetical protein
MEKTFKVCVEDPERNAVCCKRTGQLGDTGRRLSGFGNGGVDEKHSI